MNRGPGWFWIFNFDIMFDVYYITRRVGCQVKYFGLDTDLGETLNPKRTGWAETHPTDCSQISWIDLAGWCAVHRLPWWFDALEYM